MARPRCTECFYCRRGTIVTYEAAYTCLHPLVMEMDHIARMGGVCSIVRGPEGACGNEGALFYPKTAENPEPLHRFRQ